jgi:hypothetical protein
MNDNQLYIATYVDIKRDFTTEGIALLVLYRDSLSRRRWKHQCPSGKQQAEPLCDYRKL